MHTCKHGCVICMHDCYVWTRMISWSLTIASPCHSICCISFGLVTFHFFYHSGVESVPCWGLCGHVHAKLRFQRVDKICNTFSILSSQRLVFFESVNKHNIKKQMAEELHMHGTSNMCTIAEASQTWFELQYPKFLRNRDIGQRTLWHPFVPKGLWFYCECLRHQL